jgi:hypothetical protein
MLLLLTRIGEFYNWPITDANKQHEWLLLADRARAEMVITNNEFDQLRNWLNNWTAPMANLMVSIVKIKRQ